MKIDGFQTIIRSTDYYSHVNLSRFSDNLIVHTRLKRTLANTDDNTNSVALKIGNNSSRFKKVHDNDVSS